MVYSTRRFVLSLALCYFVRVYFSPFSIAITCFMSYLVYFFLVFFSPFSIAITSLGLRAYLSDFRTSVRFEHVWFCLFPLPLGAREGLRLVTVSLPPWTFLLPFFEISLPKRFIGEKENRTKKGMINTRMPILCNTIQQVKPNVCIKFQTPRCNSFWEIFHDAFKIHLAYWQYVF